MATCLKWWSITTSDLQQKNGKITSECVYWAAAVPAALILRLGESQGETTALT